MKAKLLLGGLILLTGSAQAADLILDLGYGANIQPHSATYKGRKGQDLQINGWASLFVGIGHRGWYAGYTHVSDPETNDISVDTLGIGYRYRIRLR